MDDTDPFGYDPHDPIAQEADAEASAAAANLARMRADPSGRVVDVSVPVVTTAISVGGITTGLLRAVSNDVSIELSASMAGTDQQLADFASRVPVESEGFYNFVIHANANEAGMYVGDLAIRINARTLAAIIRGAEGYAGQPVRLIACDAGAEANGLAQQLADELQVAVLGATKRISLRPNGTFFFKNGGKLIPFNPSKL